MSVYGPLPNCQHSGSLCDEVTTAHVYPALLWTSINRGRATMGYPRASSPLLCRA